MNNYDKIARTYMNDGVNWTVNDIDPEQEPLYAFAIDALETADEHKDLTIYKDIMARGIITLQRMRDAVEVE